jgi:hypothetical protein
LNRLLFVEEPIPPAGGNLGATLKFELGRGFGARGEWAVSARYMLPLTENSDKHTFVVG